MTLNQRFGYVIGAVYLLVGVAGFLVTGGVPFAATEGNLLMGLFEVNPLHNLVHLAIGGAFVWGAAAGPRPSQATNLTIGVVYLAVGILGPFLTGTEANILALNVADHWLHILSGAAAVIVALTGARRRELVRT